MKLFNRHTMPKDIEATYIGRGTRWGNKFKVQEGESRGVAADKYRKHLARFLAASHKEAVQAVLAILEKENICCSCAPRPCHGDCFVEIANIRDSERCTGIQAIHRWVRRNGYDFGPDTDGITHINVYSKGKTELGRMLTNISDIPVKLVEAGEFRSMEGYWYWLSTGRVHDQLKRMSGFEAKKFAKDIPDVPFSEFKNFIRRALWLRAEQNHDMKQAIIDSTLPFKHYYWYGETNPVTIYPMFDWITNELELIRDIYQGRKSACVIAGSRTIQDPERVEKAILDSGYRIDVVVCGEAKGVDTLGEQWALANGKEVRYFKAHWDELGKGAGFIRNGEMARFAQSGIVLIDNNSRGSVDMKEKLEALGKPVYSPS